MLDLDIGEAYLRTVNLAHFFPASDFDSAVLVAGFSVLGVIVLTARGILRGTEVIREHTHNFCVGRLGNDVVYLVVEKCC